jgi:predicted DNA-binding transcriptional regulator AlpA
MQRKTKLKESLTSTTALIQRDSILTPPRAPTSDVEDFIPGPKLRAKLGISAVTLWRWRHDEACNFPAPKVINGRLYFPLAAVSDWLARQQEVA